MKLKAKIREAAQRMKVSLIHDRIHILSGKISEVEDELWKLKSAREQELLNAVAAKSVLASLQKDL